MGIGGYTYFGGVMISSSKLLETGVAFFLRPLRPMAIAIGIAALLINPNLANLTYKGFRKVL